MNLKALQEPFHPNDIDWRVGQAGKKRDGGIWAKCVAYIQARAVMERLDAVCGPHGWRVEYRAEGGKDGFTPGFIARIGIKIGDEWVYREDGAEQTDIESFKGGISGALKRAGAAWGIGRYLYNLDAAFAEVVADDRRGAYWGKTKDGTEFYWMPPRLPDWALPAGFKYDQPAPAPKPAVVAKPAVIAPKAEQPKPAIRTRNAVSADIMEIAAELNCGTEELGEWAWDLFKKDTKLLTLPELENFLGVLQGELGRKGELA